jgi:hypothetical protein
MSEFKLLLHDKMISRIDPAKLPNVPLKRLTIVQYGKNLNTVALQAIVDKYRTTIEDLDLPDIEMKKGTTIVGYDYSLRHIALPKLKALTNTTDFSKTEKFHNIPGIIVRMYSRANSIDYNADGILSLFMHNLSIEKLHITQASPNLVSSKLFKQIINTLPNVKRFSLDGDGSGDVLLYPELPLALEVLYANNLDFAGSVQFLENQKGNLKELHLQSWPSSNVVEILEAIVSLNFEKFYCNNILMISKGKPVHVKEEVSFRSEEIECGLEILKGKWWCK